MLNEMVLATIPQGLFKGTSGFCPVAVTKGMPKELIQLLADLGKRQYEMAVANQTLGREVFNHLPLTIKGRSMHLLARGIQLPSKDPTRQKFVVHQLLLENVRDLTAGPAWVLANDKGWINQWNHEPQFLETREIDNCSLSPRICETWAQVTGDAGWAGVALEAWQRRKPFALVIPPTMPSRVVVDLFVEAQSLMDHHLRWKLPISIAAWHPSQDLQRMWVAYPAGSREAINSLRASDRVSVDISRKLEPATNSFSQVAKAGAWARFSQVDGVSSSKTPDNRPSPSPMFEGAVSKSDVVGLPLPSPSPRPAEAQRPLGVLPKAKGNSADNKLKKRISVRQIIPWIKRGVAATALLMILFGVWKGTVFLKNFALMVDSTAQSNSAGPATNKESVDADDRKIAGKNSDSTKIFDKQKDATLPIATDNPADVVEPKSARALALSESAGRRLLNQLQADFPSIDFPVKVSDQAFLAFSIPGSESLLTSLGFGLATPHQFFLLKQENHGNTWSLNHEDGGQGLLRGTLSVTPVTDENGKNRSQFSWNWQTAPEMSLASEIKSGTFVVWLHETPEIMATIPLAPPSSGNSPSLLDALYDGISFKTHLFEELARPETASKIKWLAEPIGIKDPKLSERGTTAVTDDLWTAVSQSGNACILRLDGSLLQREITKALPGNSNEQNEKINNALQSLIEKIAPIQLQIRMDSPKYVDANGETLVTKATATIFMKGDDGSMSSVIFYHEARSGEESRKQEFERRIHESLIRWLATNLNLDARLVEAVTTGKSYSPKSAATAEDRAKAAFAKKFVELISQKLDRKFMFRAVRSTELMADSRVITVAIPAYQTNN